MNYLNLPTRFANMSCKHQNINFTVEKEKVGSPSFLDVKICSKNGNFVISVYRKPTFGGVFTNYESSIPITKREDFYRHYFIMLGFQDTSFWKWSFEDYPYKKKKYLLNFIDSCIKSFLNKLYTPKVVVPNVPKRNAFVKLPFLGSTLFQIREKLQILFSDKLTICNWKIVFTLPV